MVNIRRGKQEKQGRVVEEVAGEEKLVRPHQKLGNPRKFLAVSTVVILGSGRKLRSQKNKKIGSFVPSREEE